MNEHISFNSYIAAYHLQEVHHRGHQSSTMRVVFLVQNTSVWDKQSPVYDILAADPAVEALIVLLPSYTAMDAAAKNRVGKYEENDWHFFHDRYPNVYDFTNILDLRILLPDYIFLALPYEGLRPMRGTHTEELAKIAKLCYIAYGTQGTKFFIRFEQEMPDLFPYLSFHFCDSAEEKAAMESAYAHTVEAGLQHFEDLGYPSFEPYLSCRGGASSVRRILWTPRWTTDAMIGGSHFFDYKDHFIAFAARYGSEHLKFVVRPHPLMFDHFIQRGAMTQQDVAAYKEQLNAYGIELDEGQYTPFEALSFADILFTDFSSLNMPFFLLNRPLIYCPNGMELTDDYEKMIEGSYVAESWEQAEYYLEQLIRYEDPAAQRREEIVAGFRKKHMGAAQRIAARLQKDYENSKQPEDTYLPDVELWIFEQKRTFASFMGGWRPGLLSNFCTQDWYEGYLAILPLRLHDPYLLQRAEQIFEELKECYTAAENREHQASIVLAMLLFADPLTLPVPLEVDLWPEPLHDDMREVFLERRIQLGII